MHNQANNTETTTTPRRLPPLGWLIRIAAIVAILLGCFAVYHSDYVDTMGEAEALELETLVTSEPTNSESAEATIPLSAITSCIDQNLIDNAEHPLNPLIDMAHHGVDVVTKDVQDYTAVITKRVRYQGRLQPEFRIFCKIRHAQAGDSEESSVPFSVYTKFLNRKKGQEAIWVENQNDNKLIAHGPSGLLNLMTLHLDPNSKMAMNGNRYPIMTIGMLNLIKQMIKKGNSDAQHGDCQVQLTRNVMVGDARCTRIEISHQKEESHFEFHKAMIFIDDDRNLPIAFRAYLWPKEPDGKPRLLESYSYSDIKVNVGLTDKDFDPANEEYDFPGS